MRQLALILTIIILMISITVVNAVNAVGVSDNGTAELWNGTLVTYTYHVNAVMGYLTLYNSSFASIGFAPGNVASVQLNLVVTNGVQYFWIQNIAHFEKFNGTYYMVWFWDDLWNITEVNAYLNVKLISGNRSFPSYQSYAAYYRYVAPPIMLVKAPFTVSCMVTVNLTHGYVNVNYWYRLNNTQFDTGWVKYDSVLIKINSTRAYITIGGFNPGNLSNDVEWVVGGYTAAAQLYVNEWNATIMLLYRYSSDWFTVVGGQSRSFDTGESVNPVAGISEKYINGVVHQMPGRVNSTYLWLINASVGLRHGKLIISVTPSKARWVAAVKGRVMGIPLNSSKVIINVSNWTSGKYDLVITLYAGNTSVYKYTYVLIIRGVGMRLWLIPLLIILIIAIAAYCGILKYGIRVKSRGV